MAFTLNNDGTVTTDTAAELLEIEALRRKRVERERLELEAEIARRAVKPEIVRPASQPLAQNDTAREATYRELYEGMVDQDKQQTLLRALLFKAPTALSDDELRVQLGLESNLDLRGLLIGIVRRAKNRGLESPIRKDMTRSDGGRKRHYRYTVTGKFREAMKGYQFRGALLESAS